MARTPSTMLMELGSQAPAFVLPDYAGTPAGQQVSLDKIAGSGAQARPFVVMFVCNHCPFVKHVREQLAQIGKDYAGRVGMKSRSIPMTWRTIRTIRPELMTVEAKAAGYTFCVLVRRDAGGREGVQGSVHAGLFPVR